MLEKKIFASNANIRITCLHRKKINAGYIL